MYTKKLKIKGKDISRIIKLLGDDIANISFNPVEEVYIFMSEKYYFRNNSELMACLIVKIEDQNNCIIDIVAGGGATGLMGNDWKAEENRVREIENNIGQFCLNRDWKLI